MISMSRDERAVKPVPAHVVVADEQQAMVRKAIEVMTEAEAVRLSSQSICK